MSLDATQPHQRAFAVAKDTPLRRTSELALGRLSPAEVSFSSTRPYVAESSMEHGLPEYSQTGLPSPYPSVYGDSRSETSPADPSSAAQYPTPQEARSNSYSTSATPTSEYGAYPQSARSTTSSFTEPSLRQYRPAASNHSGSSGGMAQTPTSPSMPLQDGRNHQPQQAKSDSDVPIDPSIAAPSPTYPHGQYSPYGPPPTQDMSHTYPQSAGGLYAQPRPDWANYGHPQGGQMPPHHVFPHTPNTGAPPGRTPQYAGQQVYSFVPIPGAQQHKRPRRRYEEIERMYKCGWNGCEKAYGTLNHLNAHVTMQSHGQKRTPEEFKEIRKEWKARKKEEEQQRKAAEEAERNRQAQAAAAAAAQAQNGADPQASEQTPSSYPPGRQVQLPPIGYQSSTQYPASQAGVPQQPLPAEYSPNNHMYPAPGNGYQPPSPYGSYGQHNGGQASH